MAGWAALALGLSLLSYALCLAAAGLWLLFALWAAVGDGVNILALLAVVCAGVILWGLLPRRDRMEAPGDELTAEEQPRLFAELQDIAGRLGVAMPERVYVTADVNAWVAERGGVFGIGRRRLMGVGLPLLSVLTRAQFRAVMAHEFAHYYTGDTSLWPWVYQARAAMARSVEGLRREELTTVLRRVWPLWAVQVVVTAVLEGYWRVSLRITQAISRKQEFRADELAGTVESGRALAEGLYAARRGSGALPVYWTSEYGPALAAGYRPGFGEGFGRFVAAPEIATYLAEKVDREVRAERRNPYDSHPRTEERVAALGGRGEGEAEGPGALTLLDGLERVEERLLRRLAPWADAAVLRSIRWEELGEGLLREWRLELAKLAAVLGRYTLGQLALALENVEEIAGRMKDPEGMLLTRGQRWWDAVLLLDWAVALALAEAGWRLHMNPGAREVRNEELGISVRLPARHLASGAMTAAQWDETCAAAGIGGIPLWDAGEENGFAG